MSSSSSPAQSIAAHCNLRCLAWSIKWGLFFLDKEVLVFLTDVVVDTVDIAETDDTSLDSFDSDFGSMYIA